MDLVGAWVRQLLGAGTATAIVPVTMLAALAVVLVGAGGFGGLGSFGQLFSGPRVSPAEEVAAREPQGTDARVAPPTIVASRTSTASRRRSERRPEKAPRARRARPHARITPGRPPRVGVAPPPALPPQAPPPPPTARPASRDRTQPVTDVLDRTVEAVRAVVGMVIEKLGQTVEKVIGPPPLGR
jgi:hypothetical protein